MGTLMSPAGTFFAALPALWTREYDEKLSPPGQPEPMGPGTTPAATEPWRDFPGDGAAPHWVFLKHSFVPNFLVRLYMRSALFILYLTSGRWQSATRCNVSQVEDQTHQRNSKSPRAFLNLTSDGVETKERQSHSTGFPSVLLRRSIVPTDCPNTPPIALHFRLVMQIYSDA